MAMLSIKVEKGFFVKGKGIKILDSRHAEGEGWKCERTNNKIICSARQQYSDGEHIIKYKINLLNGAIRLIHKVPNKEKEILQQAFKNRKVLDGELLMSKGNVELDSRYVFYRETAFSDFLKKYHIDKYKYMQSHELLFLKLPVGRYVAEDGKIYNAKVISYTDFTKEIIHKNDDIEEVSTYFSFWVIHDIESVDTKSRKRILYTSIKEIEDLEKKIEEKEKEELQEIIV